MFFALRHKKYAFLFLAFLIFLSFAVTVFAASSTYLTEATKYFNKQCKIKVKGDEAAICYLFERLKETDQTVISLQTENNAQQNKIDQLEQKVASLEATPAPLLPKNIVFAQNRPQPFNSDWIDVRGGYKTLTISLSITGSIADYAIHVTNDPENATDLTGYTVQLGVTCGGSVCPEKTVTVIGDYYRISTGTANGNITALGVLHP